MLVDVPAGAVDAVFAQPARGVERGEQVVVRLDELVHGDDGFVVEIADLFGLLAGWLPRSAVIISPMYSRVRSVASITRFWRMSAAWIARPTVTTFVASVTRPVDRLAEPVVVLAGELDAHEVLDVDLLHRAQVLDPHGDVVQWRPGPDHVRRGSSISARSCVQLVQQQLAEEGLTLDRHLLRLDVFVELAQLDVVAGEQTSGLLGAWSRSP